MEVAKFAIKVANSKGLLFNHLFLILRQVITTI